MAEQEDPFDRLENAVKKQDAEEKSAKLFSQARARLVLGQDPRTVFFAAMALKMQPVQDWSCKTAATDGTRIIYNPEWFAQMSMAEAKGVIAHEVLHVAMKHHTRRESRDSERWNIAADLAINPILVEAGMTLRDGHLYPGKGEYQYIPDNGLSTEEIYALLQKKGKGKDGQGKGDGQGEGQGQGQGDQPHPGQAPPDPGNMGGVMDPGDGSQAAKQEAEAKANVDLSQAEQLAKRRGELPAGLARLVDAAVRPKVNWRDVLREFVSAKCKEEFRWTPPNRRFIHDDIYLPSRSGETLGEIGIAVDTSGSIGPEVLRQFAGALEGIIEAFPVKLKIVYHDAQIAGEQEWEPSDGPLQLDPKGGGGTSHVPVFDYFDREPEPPTCLICLTDLYTDFPKSGPAYPVLWCVVDGPTNPKAPFGQVLVIDD